MSREDDSECLLKENGLNPHENGDLLTANNNDELDKQINRSDQKKNTVTSSNNLLLPISSMVASLGGILFGYDIGVISGAMLQLRAEFKLSCEQQEMVVTSLLIGCFFGALSGGFLLDKFGRKVTIILNTFVFSTGAIVLAIAQNYPVLVVGRLILGFAVSLSAIGDCVYISEIAPPARRGMLVSLNEFGISLGILLAYLTSFLLINVQNGWRYMFGISIIPAMVQLFGMVFLPESPRWLIIKRKEDKACEIIKQIWPYLNAKKEANRLKESVSSENRYGFLDLFRKKGNLRMRMLIGCGVVLFQQLSGQATLIYYAPTLFQVLGFNTQTSSTLVTVGLGVIKVVFTFGTLCFVDKLGRRRFLLLGATVMTIGVVTLTIVTEPFNAVIKSDACRHSHVALDDTYPTVVKVVSVVAIMMFIIGYAVGYGPMSWLLLTEIFPTGIKGRAVAIATSVNWGANILVSITFLSMIGKFGIFYTFLVYSLVGILSIVFIYQVVPETKAKSLEEIDTLLKTRKLRCCKATTVETDETTDLLGESDFDASYEEHVI